MFIADRFQNIHEKYALRTSALDSNFLLAACSSPPGLGLVEFSASGDLWVYLISKKAKNNPTSKTGTIETFKTATSKKPMMKYINSKFCFKMNDKIKPNPTAGSIEPKATSIVSSVLGMMEANFAT